ncbi:MAG: TIGR04255 family protein [Nitrospiraceae bacterium]|nr:MAG: TIGR04255 family protein [Nitrospiraceae bacterium]
MSHTIPNVGLKKVDLPGYKNPPINEVVCGMRFHVPDKFRITHVGLLWDKFRKDYPIIQHAAPVATAKGEIHVDMTTGLLLPRVWFISESDDQLIQFQLDRFYYNWRRRQSEYPRYSHVINNFESILNIIEQYFNEYELGELQPIELELSYINHIPKGQGWDTIDDLSNIFSDFIWKQSSERFLPSPDKITWKAEFLLPEKKGQMVVNLKQATRTEDKVPLFVLELTARSIGGLESKKAIREWFDTAHEWIVCGFTDLTTSEIQKIWEREK